MYYVWLVLFCTLNCVLTQQNEENDPCELFFGERGVCQLLSKCPYAQNLLRNGLKPNHCGYSVYEPIVCCESVQAKEPEEDLKNQRLKGERGALSKKKCREFYPKPEVFIAVAGGERSLAKEFPHMAIIGYGDDSNQIQWLCGGSLISHNHILTAAHCLNAKRLGPARWVRLGDLDLATNEDDAQPQNFTVKSSVAHPLYKPGVRYHDIAVIELDRKVTLTTYVSPACLNTDQVVPNQMTATGWGNTEYAGGSSSFLLKVDLKHVRNDICTANYSNFGELLPKGIVDDLQICAGGVIGQDTCQGDSGGPLQVPNKERTFHIQVHTLVGITSFGQACGLSKAPGVYTRVSNYILWIEHVVWPFQYEGAPRADIVRLD